MTQKEYKMKRPYYTDLLTIVSKEAAIKLREMGYDQFCDCYYHTDEFSHDDDWELDGEQICNSTFSDNSERVAAPYVSEAILWLMRHKGVAMNVSVKIDRGCAKGYCYIVAIRHSGAQFVSAKDRDYQAALFKAIDELLTKVDVNKDITYKITPF